MVTDTSRIPTRTFTDPATVRLINTAYLTEPALAPLADSDAERAILEALEGLTSSRRAPMARPAGVADDELLTEAAGYGWSYVNAAFCYTRTGGNRFNDETRGAWYACWGPDAAVTAQREIVFHLTRELDAVGVYENRTAYRELVAGFTATFHDLTADRGAPWLNADPAQGYPAGQALAATIRSGGGNGVLYPSVRHDGGYCLAAFRPALVQNVRQGRTFAFVWAGRREPSIQ